MKYCTRCGRPLQVGSESCTSCGATVQRPAATRGAGLPRSVMLTGAGVVLGIFGLAAAIGVARFTPASHTTSLGSTTPAGNGSADGSANPPSPSPQPATTQPPSPSLSAEQVAAQNVAQLLARSVADRTAVTSAFSDVLACGSGLAQDVQTFQQAATSRQGLLSQLGTLTDSAALPAQLLQDLSGAWRASYQADQDYASWSAAENASRCVADDTANSSYQAATGPDNQATTDKQDFVGLWNPIASQYGLSTYQWSDL